MSIIAWNTRGLNDPVKQLPVKNRITECCLFLVGLLETRVKSKNCLAIVNRHFSGWSFVHNYTEASNGRIWVLWKPNISVSLHSMIDQCITLSVTFENIFFMISFIYGANDQIKRRSLWSYLVEMQESFGQQAWLLLGDFNVLACPSECSRFDGNYSQGSDIKEFCECMDSLGCFDQGDSFQARKLDRVLINSFWIDFFSTKVEFLSPSVSDHCAALVIFS